MSGHSRFEAPSPPPTLPPETEPGAGLPGERLPGEGSAADGAGGDRLAGLRRWRERVRRRRTANLLYRLLVAVVGGGVAIGGLALVPLPGPGWAIVIVGLAVLASEFTWAHRVLVLVKQTVQSWARWLQRQPMAVRALVALATVAFVALVLYGVLTVLGVPGWVPDRLLPAWLGLTGA